MRIRVMKSGALAGRDSIIPRSPWFLAPCGARHRWLFYVVPLQGSCAAAPLSTTRSQDHFEPYEAESLEALESLEARSVV